MIDQRIAEEVYLPWLLSVLNGTLQLQPGAMLHDKKEFIPMCYSGFTKEAFAMGGRSAMEAMQIAPAGSVAVIPVIGEFLKYGTECSYGANEIVPSIYQAADSANIISVVLEGDSGGGAENAVPPFIEAIKYLQSKGKPIVGHGDMAASAMYYIFSFCNYLLADNLISSAWGGVGVYIPWTDIREKLKKEGIEQKYFYAPQSSLKNNEYRELVDNDNPQPLIDNLLKPSADRFITTVQENRKGKIKDGSDVLRGQMYEGQAIVEEGLADGFGTLYDAIEIAASMAMFRKL